MKNSAYLSVLLALILAVTSATSALAGGDCGPNKVAVEVFNQQSGKWQTVCSDAPAAHNPNLSTAEPTAIPTAPAPVTDNVVITGSTSTDQVTNTGASLPVINTNQPTNGQTNSIICTSTGPNPPLTFEEFKAKLTYDGKGWASFKTTNTYTLTGQGWKLKPLETGNVPMWSNGGLWSQDSIWNERGRGPMWQRGSFVEGEIVGGGFANKIQRWYEDYLADQLKLPDQLSCSA